MWCTEDFYCCVRFCSGCSVKVRLDARYCWNCKCDQAAARPRDSPTSTSSSQVASSFVFGRPTSTIEEGKKRRIVPLSDYIKAKTSKERGGEEFRWKKKKANKSQDVNIQIGIKTLVDGSLKSKRGKRLPIRVPKSSTCKQLLNEGVEKWKKFDRHFDASKVLFFGVRRWY